MIHYPLDTIYLSDGRCIALKYVESLKYPGNEDLTVDILKDDLSFSITMISGRDYVVSVRSIKVFSNGIYDSCSNHELREAICHKWKYLLGKQK